MKRYYNTTTKEWYNEGQSMTRRVENGVFAGIPSEEQLDEWGFKEYLEPELSPEELLDQAKQIKIAEIENYDLSEIVNSFEITNQGTKITDYWLSRDLRTSLEGDVLAAQKFGNIYKFDIRELGISLTLNCLKFLDALTILRQYAYTAYNVTSLHLAAIKNLTTIEDVLEYDYTKNYPEKLSFEITELI